MCQKLMGFLMMLSAAVWAAPDGAGLYATHCASCHGDKGSGGVGVPLALPSFLDSVDDAYLRKTIRQGRPGRVMPAFQRLSEAQLDALVGHMRGWSDRPAPVFPSAPVTGNVTNGKQLFAERCATCHGQNGEGGEGTGVTFSRSRDLPIIAPALNNPGFLAAASDQQIRHALLAGREGTPMQSFLKQGLSEGDIADLVSYVRSFGEQKELAPYQDPARQDAVIKFESPYTLEETVENLKTSIVGQNFLLIRTEFLEHGLVAEGRENRKEVLLHFCNFQLLYKALAIDPRVGMFLPCRINVVERDGKVRVMSINPLYLSRMFNNSELDEACLQLHGIYREIIEDATL